MRIDIKKLRDSAIVPSQAHKGDAGVDLYACVDEQICIAPGDTIKIPTGIAMAVPEGYFGAIFARSGLATKQGLRPANCVGVCDSQYRGEYIVALHNDSDETRTVECGDRIAQLVILPCVYIDFNVVDSLDDTERDSGGFGSSGI